MQVENTIELLRTSYPEGPPAESEILSQTVEYHSRDWLENYPAGFAIPDFLGEDEIGQVSREQLLQQAHKVESPADAMAFFVHIMCWGHGKSASRKWQAYRAMNAPQAAEKLFQSFSEMREIGAVEAYRRHQRRGQYHLDQLGSSFFTKWLYFSGYETWDGATEAPLILDKRVAKALGWVKYRFSGRYQEFLTLAEAVQKQWAPNNRTHVVEYALFRL